MDLTTITIANFKTQFARDFPYLPNWDSTALYNQGNIVYYANTGLFYQGLQNYIPVNTLPTNATYWQIYQDDIYNYIIDNDITNAFTEAQQSINQALFTADRFITLGYLYLSAHYLVNDITTSNAGIQSIGSLPLTAKSVGNVSESYSVPQWYLDNPLFLFFNKTGYGQKYLSMIQPYLVGNVVAVCGTTLP